MKKFFKFLPVWAMALAVGFAGCSDDDKKGNLDEVIEDGFYVVGQATVSETPLAKLLMTNGFNEAAQPKDFRAGMYEKYIALEAGKPFQLILVEGSKQTKYGSDDMVLTDTLKGTDEPNIKVYRGSIAADGKALTVATSGLYHVVLDLDLDGAIGKKFLMIAPCAWGVRGAMNGWGYTAGTSAFNKESMTFTIPNNTLKKGNMYKFAYAHGWKIEVDMNNYTVKCEISLGKDLKVGVGDIAWMDGRGVYDIKLTWNLASGSVDKGFSAEYTKTADVPAGTDPGEQERGIIGNAYYRADGTTPADWADGDDVMFVSAGKTGTVYTYTIDNIVLIAEKEFKIRANKSWGTGEFGWNQVTLAGNDVANFSESGGNIKVAVGGTYSVKFEFDYAEEWGTLTLTKK